MFSASFARLFEPMRTFIDTRPIVIQYERALRNEKYAITCNDQTKENTQTKRKETK